MDITTKKVLKYVLLPGLVPRFRELFASGFGYVSFFLAQVYRAARLLPSGHPYLMPANTGRYGIRHVVAEAANHLSLKKENADQIVIFFLTLIGLAILFIQFCMLGFAIMVGTAHAAMPTNFAEFFVTQNATHDVAFVMLDRVFGIPDFFNSCVAQNIPCFNFSDQYNPDAQPDGPFPWPFHEALRSVFQLYSVGLLVIGVLILLYFIVAITAETAQEGTPFGKRFNHVWAPLRLVVAMGLLIPIANGLNSGQYIVLYAAKWGSGFATNGWNLFTDTAITGQSTLLGEQEQLVAVPNPPELTNLLEFNTVLQTCWAAYRDIVKPSGVPNYIRGYLVKNEMDQVHRALINDTSYQQALEFYDYGDIHVVFGLYCEGGDARCPINTPGTTGSAAATPVYSARGGYVMPYCGELVLQTSDLAEPGAVLIQERYYETLMKDLWLGSDGITGGLGQSVQMEIWGKNFSRRYACDTINAEGDVCDRTAPIPTSVEVKNLIDLYKQTLQDILEAGAEAEITQGDWSYISRELGWGGAAIWYNKIAQMNGAVITATQSLPFVKQYPLVMEHVKTQRMKEDSDITGRNAFRPYLSDKKSMEFERQEDRKIAVATWHAYDLWTDQYLEPSNNIIVDSIRAIFGLEGLYNITENTDIHPLAQLVAVGKSLVESAIRNLGFSLGTGVAGGISMIFQFHKAIGEAAMVASSFFSTIAMIGLGIGFVLFYVVPFLPFIYFFFAVGGWVKGIFEAMVGVPLWALAHLRIDGNGLPGEAALGGYFLVLEVFLRPIMIVFGLLAGILIFAAQVRVLHEIWELVTSNLAGFDTQETQGLNPDETGGIDFMRDIVDQFFFTVIYTIVVYMLGMASFKLVDQIPNQILRWMGQSVQSFGDQDQGDVAENLVRNTMFGTNMLGGNLQEATGSLRSAVQHGGGKIQEILTRQGPG